ncbi:unnamed protein product [Musa acuminata subsp. burmannicoides]
MVAAEHRRHRRRREAIDEVRRRAGVQVPDQERGRGVHGCSVPDEPGQGPHGELVLLEGCGVERRHPLQQGVRDDGVRVPRHGRPVQQGVQRGNKEPLHHPHQEAARHLPRLRGRLGARRRRRRHRRHPLHDHRQAPPQQGHQLRPPSSHLRGATLPRGGTRRRRHVRERPKRRCNLQEGQRVYVSFNAIQLRLTLTNAVSEKGKMIVVECAMPVVPEPTPRAQGVFNIDLIMLAHNPGGKERTEKEFEGLAKEAGFSGFKASYIFANTWVMEFTK